MKYKGIIKKSRTLDKETALLFIGIIGVVQEYLPMVQNTLGENYGFVMMGFAVIGFILRFKTTGPVGDK